MTNLRSNRGFTLIELLVVISIIALLISILLPALSSARKSAQEIQCASSQRQIATSMRAFANDFDSHFPWNYTVSGLSYMWNDMLGAGGYDGRSLPLDDALSRRVDSGNGSDIYVCPLDDIVRSAADPSLSYQMPLYRRSNVKWAPGLVNDGFTARATKASGRNDPLSRSYDEVTAPSNTMATMDHWTSGQFLGETNARYTRPSLAFRTDWERFFSAHEEWANIAMVDGRVVRMTNDDLFEDAQDTAANNFEDSVFDATQGFDEADIPD